MRVVPNVGIFFGCERVSDGACICAIRIARSMERPTGAGGWSGACALVDASFRRRWRSLANSVKKDARAADRRSRAGAAFR